MESDQIWNQVAKFMQQLRGENLSKKSIIQIPGQKNAKNELEKIQAIGKERMKHMKETEQRITQKWIECLEDNASLEAQQAYCQGYIDCLFLLCGMGIIEKDSVAKPTRIILLFLLCLYFIITHFPFIFLSSNLCNLTPFFLYDRINF